MITWSTHQLTEYFAALSLSVDEDSAFATAVELATEMVDAELGCVLLGEELHGRCGFSADIPVEDVRAVAYGGGTLKVSRLGDLQAVANRLGTDMPGSLVVARLRDSFSPEERHMLQGMAQVLGLALRGIRALATERALRQERERESAERLVLLESARSRQLLVETLLDIQRAISNRLPLAEILDEVTGGAAKLLNGAVVVLMLAEPGQRDKLAVASTSGGGRFDDFHVPQAAARAAMAAGAVLVRPFDPDHREWGTVVAAPVRVTGEMAGSLVAHLSGDAERPEQRDQLAAFAQQVSLALADARTVEAVREARLDPLTGLPNRALFLEILKGLLSGASSGHPACVLFIDLDRFKAVNDSLGHEAGDHLLTAVAARIRSCVRETDTAARLGGDEFAILLPDSRLDAAVSIADRMIALIRQPFELSGRDAFIGASVGIASTHDTSAGADELLNNADVAMYRAKKERSGSVVVFEESMHTEALSYLSLREDLQRALRDSQFKLQYQPIARMETGEMVAVEALIRWQSPTRGLVLPANFIPASEETGVILDIGQWVLKTAAVQAARWRHTSAPDLRLNINVSGRQLVHPPFAREVTRTLADAGLPPHAVTLELTESALMADRTTMKAALSDLKDLGVRLAVDDFGTGCSSLLYLRELPVDELKIDRTFISGKALSAQDLAVVRAVIDLGRTLDLTVVAEGIANSAQWDALRGLGCPLGQGPHLCGPVDPADVPAILTRAPLAASAGTSW